MPLCHPYFVVPVDGDSAIASLTKRALPRSGRPSTSTTADNIDKIRTLVLENRYMSVREFAQECDISTTSAHGSLSDILHMKRVAARLVPKD
ncbi:hypothetical protein NQ318_001130 [Aromia moschata]|uniref:Uncharacterized protein n=1 Tax=Aromia moschata TaxID=1265417 RepID=A0AAV8ZH00_9CUCU|nr:hypothetical protein NQ318_001130 [Aromia moschata]